MLLNSDECPVFSGHVGKCWFTSPINWRQSTWSIIATNPGPTFPVESSRADLGLAASRLFLPLPLTLGPIPPMGPLTAPPSPAPSALFCAAQQEQEVIVLFLVFNKIWKAFKCLTKWLETRKQNDVLASHDVCMKSIDTNTLSAHTVKQDYKESTTNKSLLKHHGCSCCSYVCPRIKITNIPYEHTIWTWQIADITFSNLYMHDANL